MGKPRSPLMAGLLLAGIVTLAAFTVLAVGSISICLIAAEIVVAIRFPRETGFVIGCTSFFCATLVILRWINHRDDRLKRPIDRP